MDLAGTRIEYRLRPPSSPSQPTLVFLHQGLGSVALWGAFPDLLADATGCGLLIYSRQGYGWSESYAGDWPLDYMEREALRVLPAVLDAFDLRDFILVGHSDGGTISLLALGEGLDARGAVIVAPHIRDEAKTYNEISVQRASWTDSKLRSQLQRYHHDRDSMFLGWSGAWLDDRFRGWTVEPAIPAIRVPILAIQGYQDAHGSMWHIDNIAQLSGGSVRLERIEDCDHNPFREKTELTLGLCTGFVKGLAGA